ncbi:MAG: hypothetical protein A2X61_01105 [Ignavibacteria bacterium GWB2_35_12]|nr:MAG: hypothetical protein A2X63_13775 [Ignavibacteria bacterium GWA2_35_8]OGU39078.1 MAG: hypothetical protein A2X61_01105 [Ignavibacteria bacterium GWB2_35_12]OGV21787.1 MAG: hypothetical protein A2475_04330 [Ignavibacteria bacterium RIFOXYC2_FULL_35_21]
MKSKFTSPIFSIIILLTIILVSCKNEETVELPSKQDYGIKIFRLSKLEFSIGDTIEVYGKNFGETKVNSVLVFDGTEVSDEGYISWNDSTIKVIVPKDAINLSAETGLVNLSLSNIGKIYIINKESNSLSYEVLRPWYVSVISYFVQISLLITVVFIYLKINKMWKRKHEREVAESQSLVGLSIYIANCVLWVCYYAFVQFDDKSLADTSIYIFEGSIFFLIGTGIFVKGQRRLGLWNLIKQALRLERKEADYLLKKWFRPANAEAIIGILHQIAMIDEEYDPKEEELIKAFAKEWNIDYNPAKLNLERHKGTEDNYIRLRKTVEKYLDREPPLEQVAQLKDMITTMIQADEKITYEEEMISSELLPMIENYLKGDEGTIQYLVLIVPQSSEQEDSIAELLPNAEKIYTSGGMAYMIDSFYSKKFAEMVCNQYREINYFTIVKTPDT